MLYISYSEDQETKRNSNWFWMPIYNIFYLYEFFSNNGKVFSFISDSTKEINPIQYRNSSIKRVLENILYYVYSIHKIWYINPSGIIKID